ncbi:hypothetical protein Emin_0585 [Elusimicrobium minutum Pei191]|uniref:Prepilin-type N-terminal cleavage/methylation domain-containing protein n=1 Tax=Elusimicrobium minutum (strain Pei191) TaxID=445932 RepID=B2KC13_ELUMP|nr:prepilin-type N-terminal cleavage/methylation domain-containing protein [Elusimicrobium minutum]ACC98140.1 hypothetical protein Emin_0585 [Elusimicrobium minutum Pei191]
MINKNKKGFTLIEILVALFLTGLVMAGLVGLWVATSNFASSSREELLYKNAFSIASKRIQKDISESTDVGFNSFTCNSEAHKQVFMQVYKNFIPGANARCVKTDIPASIVIFCYNTKNQTIYRRENAISCSGGAVSMVCDCDDLSSYDDFLVRNVTSIPVASQSTTINGVNLRFTSEVKVGKNRRPISLVFDKSFAYLKSW